MNYYEVLVATAAYHGQGALTYGSEQSLARGNIVQVPLQRQKVLGVVTKKVSKPKFKFKLLAAAYELPTLTPETLELISWMQGYYPAPLGMIVQQFLPKSLSEKLISKNSGVFDNSQHKVSALPALTDEQRKVLGAADRSGSYLLHGETGSGKTRIYLELAIQSMKAGRSALILTPEINLTTQLVADFQAIFGNQVLLVHSGLTEAQRRTTWLTIVKSSKPVVVIGTRSGLFCPFRNLGLIVLDEAHETAYKQEQTPHYHALRVASKLATLYEAKLIAGSATPTVSDYYTAHTKGVPILRMEKVARIEYSSNANNASIIDLKDRSQFTLTNHFSNALIEAIEQALKRREQSLLFLNRRGTARVVMCEVCGWQALCPHCDVPLTYHADGHRLRCHSCNHQESARRNCPICLSPDILFKGVGTKAIVEEIQKLFPQARIQRFDTDNKKAESLANQYTSVKSGDVDILVGTQTLAKGLDLPRLSVVGVITADTSLYMPDYTAGERTYQLITQVIGRIGRGHIEGQAIIQTYQPNNSIIQAATRKDWKTFYENELVERQTFLFPPFCFLLKVTCRRAKAATAQSAAEAFAHSLRQQPLKIQINGPMPAFHEKADGQHQWQLIIKAKQRTELLKVIKLLPNGWSYDIDPVDLL